MSSIIEFFNANKLKYTASSNGNDDVNYAFDKNDNRIQHGPNAFWMVTFERIVTIVSYFITSKSSWTSWYMKSWDISYSIDGSTFNHLQTDSVSSLHGNTKIFPLNKQINCKSFKITAVSDSDGESYLLFNSFDCFSPVPLKKTIKQCSCNCVHCKNRMTSNFLLLFTFITTK